MAHKVSTELWSKKSPNIKRFGAYLYNLDGIVGPGCLNQSDDVMLVQAFIKLCFDWRGTPRDKEGKLTSGITDSLSFPAGLTLDSISGARSIEINGRFDNTIRAWIEFYQLHFFSDDRFVTGKVEPARADGSSVTNPRHTLLHMNAEVKYLFPLTYDDLRKHGKLAVPAALIDALQ